MKAQKNPENKHQASARNPSQLPSVRSRQLFEEGPAIFKKREKTRQIISSASHVRNAQRLDKDDIPVIDNSFLNNVVNFIMNVEQFFFFSNKKSGFEKS